MPQSTPIRQGDSSPRTHWGEPKACRSLSLTATAWGMLNDLGEGNRSEPIEVWARKEHAARFGPAVEDSSVKDPSPTPAPAPLEPEPARQAVDPLARARSLHEAAKLDLVLTSAELARLLGHGVDSWEDGHEAYGYRFTRYRQNGQTLWTNDRATII